MKLEYVKFVEVADVERIHEEALRAGGAAGVLDRNLLISAVEMPRSTFDGVPLYPSIAEMAAAYAWGIARNHPFVDGNKRTALLTALTFLAVHGQTIRLGPEWVEIMVRVASDDTFTRLELVEAFRHELGSDEPIS
ncbi:MAG TPA: type II toxin-antitoxin system death-on-curing family toxin [Polyangiaceae bacterium]|nr:type II toxin-antitoxin system death-on-curing family toxin [Polyangiaceae bacterium]